jgi:hypothetical protein
MQPFQPNLLMRDNLVKKEPGKRWRCLLPNLPRSRLKTTQGRWNHQQNGKEPQKPIILSLIRTLPTQLAKDWTWLKMSHQTPNARRAQMRICLRWSAESSPWMNSSPSRQRRKMGTTTKYLPTNCLEAKTCLRSSPFLLSSKLKALTKPLNVINNDRQG